MSVNEQYEDLQVKLESKGSSISGKYHKMNKFVRAAVETSDRVLSKEQYRRQQRKAIRYNKHNVFEETEAKGVFP